VITSAVIIRDQSISLNGKLFFTDREGDLQQFLTSAYSFLKIEYPKFYKMDRLSQLGFLAAEILLKDRKLSAEYSAAQIGLVISNANSSLDTDMKYAASAKTIGSPALFVYTLPNIVAGEICIRHGFKGENAFFVTPEFDADLMSEYLSVVPSPATLCGWIDVLGEQHDVFLYLHEKKASGGIPHSAKRLKELYTTALWNN
jgi:hypothetical protein